MIYFSDIVNSIAETSDYSDVSKITMDLQEALEPQIPAKPKIYGRTHGYYFSKDHRVVGRQPSVH